MESSDIKAPVITNTDKIKKFIEQGPINHRFNLEQDIKDLSQQIQLTRDVRDAGYLSDESYLVQLMMINSRLNMIKCFQAEMFDRFNGLTGG